MMASRNWQRAASALGVLLCTVIATAAPAVAGSAIRYGVLSCDISGGIGLIFTEKQTMKCVYRPDDGTAPETYVGSIEEVGIELGATSGGELTWTVVSLERGVPRGALAGTYIGLAANASIGEGFGANDLSGGFNRSYILQPYSVQTQSGTNFAAGMAKVTLRATD